METVYLFDLDGTLTWPRRPMTPEHTILLRDFSAHHKVVVITGSDWPKAVEQLNGLEQMLDVHTCAGNVFHRDGAQVEARHSDLLTDPVLMAELERFWQESPYQIKTGNHIEVRSGMLNVSVVGRNATQYQRKEYNEYDSKTNERRIFAQNIQARFPSLHTAIGGEISIDLVEKNYDKSQVVAKLSNYRIEFFGDKVKKGGNDHEVAEAVRASGGKIYEVGSPTETFEILEHL